MKGYSGNIEKETLENNNFRQVLYTGKHLQLVVMCLKGGEDIGAEVHLNNDQFFRFESGSGKCIIDTNEYLISEGDVIVVPAGATHNIINTNVEIPLKMYTIYGPPNHQDSILRIIKEEAEKNAEHFDGKLSE